MKKPSGKLELKVREYFAEIGHRGGVMSRRQLTRNQAKEMVAIREAKRAARKAGKIASTRERWPLTTRGENKKSRRRLPAIRRRRMIGNVLPY